MRLVFPASSGESNDWKERKGQNMQSDTTSVSRSQTRESEQQQAQPRVVIVGAGFGGLEAARALRNAPVQVTVIAW
jgi:NADPH-dependent 2,4-dienoyl-CoA reductase/sulfur reductase-like enzyme